MKWHSKVVDLKTGSFLLGYKLPDWPYYWARRGLWGLVRPGSRSIFIMHAHKAPLQRVELFAVFSMASLQLLNSTKHWERTHDHNLRNNSDSSWKAGLIFSLKNLITCLYMYICYSGIMASAKTSFSKEQITLTLAASLILSITLHLNLNPHGQVY